MFWFKHVKIKMNKIIKSFKMFPTGSYAYDSREIKSEQDIIQLTKEITELNNDKETRTM